MIKWNWISPLPLPQGIPLGTRLLNTRESAKQTKIPIYHVDEQASAYLLSTHTSEHLSILQCVKMARTRAFFQFSNPTIHPTHHLVEQERAYLHFPSPFFWAWTPPPPPYPSLLRYRHALLSTFSSQMLGYRVGGKCQFYSVVWKWPERGQKYSLVVFGRELPPFFQFSYYTIRPTYNFCALLLGRPEKNEVIFRDILPTECLSKCRRDWQ